MMGEHRTTNIEHRTSNLGQGEEVEGVVRGGEFTISRPVSGDVDGAVWSGGGQSGKRGRVVGWAETMRRVQTGATGAAAG